MCGQFLCTKLSTNCTQKYIEDSVSSAYIAPILPYPPWIENYAVHFKNRCCQRLISFKYSGCCCVQNDVKDEEREINCINKIILLLSNCFRLEGVGHSTSKQKVDMVEIWDVFLFRGAAVNPAGSSTDRQTDRDRAEALFLDDTLSTPSLPGCRNHNPAVRLLPRPPLFWTLSRQVMSAQRDYFHVLCRTQ